MALYNKAGDPQPQGKLLSAGSSDLFFVVPVFTSSQAYGTMLARAVFSEGDAARRGQPKRLASSNLMLGKLSTIGAVAAIIMIPTALSAQMGGAVNPGVHVMGAVNPGATVRGAVERGIPGPDLGTWRSPSREIHRSRKHSMTTTKQRR